MKMLTEELSQKYCFFQVCFFLNFLSELIEKEMSLPIESNIFLILLIFISPYIIFYVWISSLFRFVEPIVKHKDENND